MFATWLSAALALACPVLGMTPEQMISAPRRGEAIPDPSGKVALFSVSQYSFETHDSKSEWDLLDLKSGKITTLTDDPNVSEIVWLGPKDTSILYLNASNSETPGGVELWFSDIENFAGGYKAASIPGPLSGLKAVKTKEGDINFVASGQSTADGKLYNPETAKKQYSTARIYDSIFPRHWDQYLTPEQNAVFSGSLTKSLGKNKGVSYAYSRGLHNLVSPIKYAESPVPPFGGSGDYDLSPDGKTVAFLSKAPELPKANYTASYIFTVPHDGSSKAVAMNGPDSKGTPKGVRGASASPAFSPDGKQIAYVQMTSPTYESDRSVIYIASLNTGKIRSVAGDWDRSPDSVKWAPNGKELYVTALDEGRGRLFSVPTDAKADYKPESFTKDGAVSAYYPLKNSKSLLVTATSIWTNAWYFTASPKHEPKTIFSANEHDPELIGMGPDDVDEFHYEGNWTKLHSWIVKPKGFSKDKKYPLAFLIHGGPQGAWEDSWSTRWNPKTWADQGYVVILPNPTGSTGFGQRLTDAIQNDWGGAPYDDLVKCWEYVRDKIDYIDTDNGIAAGASYGGFMINYIQGQDLGRKFKALVVHDGVFIGENIIATDELWFIQHEYNGTFWDNRENYLRWDPAAAESIKRFATPQLIIHSDLDYRLPVTDGIALFNVLQELGVPSRFLNFPDQGHWVLSQENSLVWHQQVLGWINKYSGNSNKDAVQLSDTVVPVVDIDAGPNN